MYDLAKQLVAAARAANSLAPVAAKVHATVQATGAVERNAEPAGLTRTLVSKLFDSPPGGVVSAPTADRDGVIVARVTGIAHPPANVDFTYQRFETSIGGQAATDFEQALAVAARQRLGVTINQQQVNRVTGGS